MLDKSILDKGNVISFPNSPQTEPEFRSRSKCHKAAVKIRTDEAPVTLVFNKIESLDVVINQLLKLREVMGGNRDARSIS